MALHLKKAAPAPMLRSVHWRGTGGRFQDCTHQARLARTEAGRSRRSPNDAGAGEKHRHRRDRRSKGHRNRKLHCGRCGRRLIDKSAGKPVTEGPRHAKAHRDAPGLRRASSAKALQTISQIRVARDHSGEDQKAYGVIAKTVSAADQAVREGIAAWRKNGPLQRGTTGRQASRAIPARSPKPCRERCRKRSRL